ncbi:roadblock/LC7 domain-containing protein [Dactylosporangium cerinum]|uniref:Roadblock/LC7 domain-containing protein n=1 Tax=Dactylosporangium cerinum TaxID=1434730 RepID=A0ABV9WCW2_9ACTN
MSVDVNFLLNDFVGRVPKVTHIVAVSVDGLLVARNQSLPRDGAERLAAIASGLVALLHGAANNLEAGQVVSNLTEMTGGLMFTMSVSSGALLALAAPGCDIGQVGHELAELINRVGPALRPQARADAFTASMLTASGMAG